MLVVQSCLQVSELFGNAFHWATFAPTSPLEAFWPAKLVKDEPVQAVRSSARLETQRRSPDRLGANVQTGHVVELAVEPVVALLRWVLRQQLLGGLVFEAQAPQTVPPVRQLDSCLSRPGILRPGQWLLGAGQDLYAVFTKVSSKAGGRPSVSV